MGEPMSVLFRCDNPPCSRCGCQETRVERWPDDNGSWYGAFGWARCGNCGLRFTFKKAEPAAIETAPALGPLAMPPVVAQEPVYQHAEPPRLSTRRAPGIAVNGVQAIPAACPKCGTVAKAYSTKGRTQYRKCPECGHRFKTLKVD
jgi:predicted RNA-binding Zn-ribbon protein involved in translation (DUF1610 family)